MPNRKHDSMMAKAYTVAQNTWTRIRIQTTSSASAAMPEARWQSMLFCAIAGSWPGSLMADG